MNAEKLKFSVCIPAYNRADVLADLLRSIERNQDTGFDVEVVIREDFSPERKKIRAVVDLFLLRSDLKIKYLENNFNYGYDKNLRALVEDASGDVIVFFGNDDLMAENALKTLASVYSSDQSIATVLRSYASFDGEPSNIKEYFYYFDNDEIFEAGDSAIVSFFRRSVFISGMSFRRSLLMGLDTDQFDGSLLYQLYLVGSLLRQHKGYYCRKILSLQRLGGIPDFGSSDNEPKHTPRRQTVDGSLFFMKEMLRVAKTVGAHSEQLQKHLANDISNYAYPFLAMHRDKGLWIFLSYVRSLAKIGLATTSLYYVYVLMLIFLNKRLCDILIGQIKKIIGRAPRFGTHFSKSYSR